MNALATAAPTTEQGLDRAAWHSSEILFWISDREPTLDFRSEIQMPPKGGDIFVLFVPKGAICAKITPSV